MELSRARLGGGRDDMFTVADDAFDLDAAAY
jgi:hypothetical protein